MILDLPVETVQAMIATAERQGVTLVELLNKDYGKFDMLAEMEKQGLNSESVNITLTEQDADVIQKHLEHTHLTPFMQEVLSRVHDDV